MPNTSKYSVYLNTILSLLSCVSCSDNTRNESYKNDIEFRRFINDKKKGQIVKKDLELTDFKTESMTRLTNW